MNTCLTNYLSNWFGKSWRKGTAINLFLLNLHCSDAGHSHFFINRKQEFLYDFHNASKFLPKFEGKHFKHSITFSIRLKSFALTNDGVYMWHIMKEWRRINAEIIIKLTIDSFVITFLKRFKVPEEDPISSFTSNSAKASLIVNLSKS